MRGYVYLSWPSDPAGRRQGEAAAQGAADAGYVLAERTDTSWCGVVGPNPPRLHVMGHALVIGDFSRVSGARVLVQAEQPETIAADLTTSAWGRYVAIFRDTEGSPGSLYRDPSGAMEAFAWTCGVIRVVASATPDGLIEEVPPNASIDWQRLAEMVRTPSSIFASPALRGIDAVGPGEWLDLDTGNRRRLWRPEAIARRPFATEAEGVRVLRSSLDHVVSVLTTRKSALGAEVSGGLDSAIVVGALTARSGRLAMALNTYSDHPETDELAFADAVARRANVALTRRRRPDAKLTAEMLEVSAGDPRPSQNGRDVFNDMAVAKACESAGINVLLTGKGGDALFFQGHTPLAFSDLWQTEGLRSLRSPLLPGVARWTRTSAWSVLSIARRNAVLDRRARRRGKPVLPPAKRHQIALIESGLAYYSTCRRAGQVDMIHPLMSQPLVEWALRTPVAALVQGGRDRALARAAFADRLPEAIRTRHSKGDYSAYFNRQVANNLAFLRGYLLDGRLAAEGLIDRPAFEVLLDPDTLRWRGGATEVLAAASLEAWVRRWERRLDPNGRRTGPPPAGSPRTIG